MNFLKKISPKLFFKTFPLNFNAVVRVPFMSNTDHNILWGKKKNSNNGFKFYMIGSLETK